MSKHKQNKRTSRKGKSQPTDDLVQIDAFMIPAAFADMYRVLREAVASELLDILSAEYATAARVNDNEVEGEAVVAYDATDSEQVRIYLNPANVSEAQRARDKQQLDKFVTQFILPSE